MIGLYLCLMQLSVMNSIVRYIDMSAVFRAFTILDDEGFYNIYINSRLSVEQQRASYMHELSHIKNGDFFSEMSATQIEQLTRSRKV